MLTLRPATMDDAADLFAWRNDPLTRAMSLQTGEVSWSEHVEWLGQALASASRLVLIAEMDGNLVGSTRLDFGDEVEVSVVMAPEYRGRELSRHVVAASLPSGDCTLRIKSENLASQRLAASVGFQMVEAGPVQLWRRHSGRTSKKLLAA